MANNEVDLGERSYVIQRSCFHCCLAYKPGNQEKDLKEDACRIQDMLADSARIITQTMSERRNLVRSPGRVYLGTPTSRYYRKVSSSDQMPPFTGNIWRLTSHNLPNFQTQTHSVSETCVLMCFNVVLHLYGTVSNCCCYSTPRTSCRHVVS